MRFGPQRTSPLKQFGHSPSKRQGFSPLKDNNRKSTGKKGRTELSYVHYNNAIYMGGMNAFKRNGRGIILFDEGTSAIINSKFENLIEHSTFIR